ncbi:MAG: hypothetical protein IT383_26595 [Deltaproteobacteria bacterium]|nr:hypothetical protein [Deltaproteobacteria bacterium]
MTDAEEVDVDGKKFRRLEQASSGTYFGRFGAHLVEEPLYREAGVRNGPTLKPVELRAGIVERMLPDMARIVGALSADDNSRALDRTLRTVGCVPPGRAFLQDHVTRMGAEIADAAAELEAAARDVTAPPGGIASISCGLDRMSVRMAEPLEGAPCSRREPYQRAPPPQMEHHYRKAWVGSVTAYDERGEELATWRCAAEADADPAQLADRIAADVAWLLDDRADVPLHCVQDAAPELRALPEALGRRVPDVEVVELVDFDHLARYLDAVVDACDPQDKYDMKAWYRSVLLDDDNGIDRIQQNLRRQAKRLAPDAENARKAMAAALRYMRKRKHKMRYASFYRQRLPIGSGATESTCWQMQQRVKLPGQSWAPHGLRGILAIRALVVSERWQSAWDHYASFHRAEVSIAA